MESICELCHHSEANHEYDGDDRYDCMLCTCICRNENFVMRLKDIQDPTYIKLEIEAKPNWKLAFELSEIDNDNAPIGWFNYIHLANHLISKYNIKPS